MRILQVTTLLALLGGVVAGCVSPAPVENRSSMLRTNQEFIEATEQSIPSINDVAFVLRYVFMNLPSEVKVYPTENFFYFEFGGDGRELKGAFRFPIMDPEVLEFGFYDLVNYTREGDGNGSYRRFRKEDGLTFENIDRFHKRVTYMGKTITFVFNDLGWSLPKGAKLTADERYLGPIQDESGIKFHFMFNTTHNYFFFLLNDDKSVAEIFRRVNPEVIVGTRSKFAFFDDTANSRKLLIGVHQENIRKNNYYDGPFDQLPDNYIEQSEQGKWMQLAFPEYKGRIDKYGNIAGMEANGARVAIAAYMSYTSDDQVLNMIAECKAEKTMTFTHCIARDMRFRAAPEAYKLKASSRVPPKAPKKVKKR